MGKRMIIASGILTALAFLAGKLLEKLHSPLTDFFGLLCFPFFTVVFVWSLLLVRVRLISTNNTTRKVFLGIRIAVCTGILMLLMAVFQPRSYGTPPLAKRADMRYWQLPTGSRIAYTLLPGKGLQKPYPVIYLLGGPGGWVDETIIRMMTPLTADGYDVYLYDQVGSGWSGRLADIRDYTAERHKKDLEAIVKETGAEKVILIGQSWGAILATLFAADNPGQVAKMIVTGPGPIEPLNPEATRTIPPDSLHLHEPYYTNHQGNERANNIRLVVIPDAGHFIFFEQPERYLSAIRDFLK